MHAFTLSDTCVHRVDWWFVLQVRETLWNPTPEVKARRLWRYTVPIDAQENYESEKWVLEVYILFWNSTLGFLHNCKKINQFEWRFLTVVCRFHVSVGYSLIDHLLLPISVPR